MEKAEALKIIWVFAMLFAGSISDIKKHSVSSAYLTVAAVGCIILSVPAFDASMCFPGLLPGLLLLLFSRLSEGAVGEADAAAVCFTGFCFGIYTAVCLLMLTLLFSGIAALILISLKKAGRKTEVALYPFLCLSFAIHQIQLKGGI